MGYPSFNSGDVLNASDMNAVGLWKIKTATLSGTATNITSCFTEDYIRYIIHLDDVSISAAGDIYWQWLSGTTPLTVAAYMWAMTGLTVGGVASPSAAAGQTLGYTGISITAGVAGQDVCNAVMTIYGPTNNDTNRQPMFTTATLFPGDWASRTGMSQYNGGVADRDGIRFLTNSAATMTGTCTVYGYRN